MSDDAPLKTALKKLGLRKLKDADRAALLSAMAEGRFKPVWANGWDPEWDMIDDETAKIRFDSPTARHLKTMAEDTTSLFTIPPPPEFWAERVAETHKIMTAIMQAGDAAVALNLYGGPGVGKTALACWIMQELRFICPAPRLFLDLGTDDAGPPAVKDTLTHLLRALAPGSAPPSNPAEMVDRYDELTAGRPLLLILDHARAGDPLHTLLPRSQSLTLITSRDPLGLKGVPEIEIPAFSEMQVIDFARRRLGEARLGEANPHIIYDLTAGLPRAVNLALGWLAADHTHRLAVLEEHLRALLEPPDPDDEAFETFVPAGPLDAMMTTVLKIGAGQSPVLMDKTRQIALMPASFDVFPAAAIWDVSPEQASERLRDLADLGFLETGRAENRYHMPAELAALMERDLIGLVREEAETRYVEFFADVIHRAALDISDGDGIAGLSHLEREWPHIQACIRLCRHRSDLAATLLKDAADLLAARLSLTDWYALWEGARDYARDLGDERGELDALDQMGRALIEQGDGPKALSVHHEQLELARALDDVGAQTDVWQGIGRIYAAMGDLPTAFQSFTKAVSCARSHGDDLREIGLLGDLERSLAELGQQDLADTAYERRIMLTGIHGLDTPERALPGSLPAFGTPGTPDGEAAGDDGAETAFCPDLAPLSDEESFDLDQDFIDPSDDFIEAFDPDTPIAAPTDNRQDPAPIDDMLETALAEAGDFTCDDEAEEAEEEKQAEPPVPSDQEDPIFEAEEQETEEEKDPELDILELYDENPELYDEDEDQDEDDILELDDESIDTDAEADALLLEDEADDDPDVLELGDDTSAAMTVGEEAMEDLTDMLKGILKEGK